MIKPEKPEYSNGKCHSDKNCFLYGYKELRLNIDEATLSEAKPLTTTEILADLYKQKELLRSGTFGLKDREFLARFPQYRRLWRWEQQLRIGYIYASELPDYDIKANAELKNILDEINRKG